MEAVSYCPLVQMTFHSSPLIFICPDPTHTQPLLYDFSITVYVLKKTQQVNSSNLPFGSFFVAVLAIKYWSSPDHRDDINMPQLKSMCLNFNFCLYHSSVKDFKSRIPSMENYPCLTHSVQDAHLCARSPPPPFDEMRIYAHRNRHDCTPRCAFERIFLLVNLNENR